VNRSKQQRERNCRRRIRDRRRRRDYSDQPKPIFKGSNIQYEWSDRSHGLAACGIGAIHLMARRTGLIDAIDENLHLLKVHVPYHESDHVLNIAYNILLSGACLEDVELRRNDEVYLNALGAVSIPDPTTAGDFCRRFAERDIEILMEVINCTRLRVWRRQTDSFFEEAIVEADGTMAPTTGECKEGMDISYDGVWGYHPLIVSLANTSEPLYLVNRSGNRPSHEGAAIGSTRQSVCVVRRDSDGFCSGATRTSAKSSTWMAGIARGCASSSEWMRVRPSWAWQRPCRPCAGVGWIDLPSTG
jgi:hypothetical protein